MSIEVKIGLSGFDQTVEALNKLPPELAKNGISRAVKKASLPILATAKERVPVLYGFLRNLLVSRTSRSRDGKTFSAGVGVKAGAARIPVDTISRGPKRGHTKYAVPARYVKAIEMGTSHAEAIPFLRPALATEAANAVDIFQYEMERQIDIAVDKITPRTTGGKP